MNKKKAIDKLEKFIRIVQSLPDGAHIISIYAYDDRPESNYIQLFDNGETPDFNSLRPHDEQYDCLYSIIDGIEVFILRDIGICTVSEGST